MDSWPDHRYSTEAVVSSADARPSTVELHGLLELAREAAPQARRRLAKLVGSLFDRALGERERDLAGDILLRLVQEAEDDLRQALSERLAGNSDAPRDLIVFLANDDIAVARPILLASEILTDDDLIDIIRDRSIFHSRSIAQRPFLSEPVGERLVATGDSQTMVSLLQNPGARLSAAACLSLADVARRVEGLQAPLLNRPEIPPELAAAIYSSVSDELRHYIRGRFKFEPQQLDEALHASMSELTDAHRAAHEVTPEMIDLAERLAETRQLTHQTMVQVLRRGQVQLFLALFARALGLDVRSAWIIVAAPGGEKLAIAAKTLNLMKSEFATLFLLIRAATTRNQVVDPGELSRVLQFYDRVTPDFAASMMKGWRSGRGAIRASLDLGWTWN